MSDLGQAVAGYIGAIIIGGFLLGMIFMALLFFAVPFLWNHLFIGWQP